MAKEVWKKRHNQKWLNRYHGRGRLRDKYPAEFKELRKTNPYSVALRLIEEAHPGEIEVEPLPERPIGRGNLDCNTCGQPLISHPLSGECRT